MKKKITAKELFEKEKMVFAPCVYDAMTARAAELSGYNCLMLSGGAIAYSMDGQPDMAFGTLDEVIAVVEAITNTVDIPLIADFDDGYAESPAVVYRNVKRLIRAGAAGFTLEDATGIRGFERNEFYNANPDVPNEGKLHPETVCISREAWLAKDQSGVGRLRGHGLHLHRPHPCSWLLRYGGGHHPLRTGKAVGRTHDNVRWPYVPGGRQAHCRARPWHEDVAGCSLH